MSHASTALLLSLRAAVLAVLLLTPLALAAALLVRRWQGQRRTLADLLLLSPLVLPPTVLGFLLLQLLGPQGPLGQPLERLGISVVFSWSATVISAAVVAFPLLYRSLLASLDQLDPALEAVALGLGASPARVFRRITLPLIRPGLLAGLSLSFARALGEFGTTMMLAGNIPGRTQTLPLAIYSAVETGELPLAWRLTAVVLLLNGGCLALVELFNQPGARRRGHATHSDADGELAVASALPCGASEAAQPPPVPAPVPLQEAPLELALEVALALERGDFRLALAWRSRAARLAVLGPSGAGKSVLLRAIAGLERPRRGRILLAGRRLADSERGIWVPPQRRRIAMVFQHHALFPHLTVAANVGFGLAHLSREQRRARVEGMLAAVGLSRHAGHWPHQLSGGQCQRVALARALVVRPDLLLLDEPLSAQDSFRRRRLQQWIADLQQSTGTPMLLVTHDIDEAHRLSDELLVIDGGRLLAHGPTRELFRQPRNLAVARLTGCKNLSPIVRQAPGQALATRWGLAIDLPEQDGAGQASWLGLRANHLRLRPATGSGGSGDPIVRPCRLTRLSEGGLQVSAYVLVDGASNSTPLQGPEKTPVETIQVELRAWEWQELRHHHGGLELVIPREALLLLQG
ncbi:MAG: molybdate ABC transporter permease subunit [Synechococcaceae cyanobacterium]